MPRQLIPGLAFRPITAGILILGLLVCVSPGLIVAQPAVAQTSESSLAGMPVTFPVQTPEVSAYFNQIARHGDIASFPQPVLHMAAEVTVGRKAIGFFSWADAEAALDAWTDQADLVMYNPEHWQQTPAGEQQDLVATVQRAAEYSHARGFRFMFAPDRLYAQQHLAEVAPYVDAVLLQGQRLQQDPQMFETWMHSMIDITRSANPQAEIWVQVGATRGSAAEMYAAIQTVAGDIDGVAIWSMPRTLNVLQEFMALLRSSPTTDSTPPAPSVTSEWPSPRPIGTEPVNTITSTPGTGDGKPTLTSTPLPTQLPPTESVPTVGTPAETASPSHQAITPTGPADTPTSEPAPVMSPTLATPVPTFVRISPTAIVLAPSATPSSPVENVAVTETPDVEDEDGATSLHRWMVIVVPLLLGLIVLGFVLSVVVGKRRRVSDS